MLLPQQQLLVLQVLQVVVLQLLLMVVVLLQHQMVEMLARRRCRRHLTAGPAPCRRRHSLLCRIRGYEQDLAGHRILG